MSAWTLVVLLFAGVFADDETVNGGVHQPRMKRSVPSSCTPKYLELGASTMCQYHDSPSARNAGVNKVMQMVIVSEHNKYRRRVKPRATNMQKMYWDDEIAAIAQKWANTCSNGHDSSDNRKVPGYGIHIGQNWATGFPNWGAAIKAWYDEVSIYRYGQDPNTYLPNGFAAIGHYTQVVRDVAGRVGCGYAECPHLREVYICNYAFGNPMDWGKPYERGPTCGACRKSCKNNLCDCGGAICLNGGTLDPNTCTCKCTDLWAGDVCDQLSCPKQDPEVCGAAWGYSPRRCEEWLNVPKECPYMCGLCPSGKSKGPNSVLPPQRDSGSERNMVDQGKNADSDLPECSAVDPDYCGKPQPYGFLPKHCKMWMNVPDDCPAMCGRCQARCGSKSSSSCKYGGRLDGVTCSCECSAPYSGERCETLASCPAVDPPECADTSLGYSKSQCDVMAFVRERCPIMCGLCQEKCPGRSGDDCANGGTLLNSCECACVPGFAGDNCKRFEKCPRAKDEFWCRQFSPADCKKYFNFPTDCPHMCKAC